MWETRGAKAPKAETNSQSGTVAGARYKYIEVNLANLLCGKWFSKGDSEFVLQVNSVSLGVMDANTVNNTVGSVLQNPFKGRS